MAYMKDASGRRLDSINVPSTAEIIGKPGNRIAPAPLSAPNAVAPASAVDLTQRTLFKLPFRAGRWRIGFRNQSLRSTTPLTTPCTITSIWTGDPVRATTSTSGSRWVGATSAALTQVQGTALTVPTDGTRVWSNWITNNPFLTNKEKVISWGLTSTNTGTGIASGNSFQGVLAQGAGNAGNATLSGVTLSANSIRLDVVLEYEFAEAVRVGLFIGDSNTVTYGPTPPTMPGGGESCLPHESWPMVAGAMGGFAAVNLGVGSTSTVEWESTLPALWDRLTPGLVPDFAVASIGTNDLGTSLTYYIGNIQNLNTKIRAMGTQSIWWTTITPRCFPNGAYTNGGTRIAGYIGADIPAGATSVQLSYPPANGAMLLGTGGTMEDVTVSAVTGTGPYTATISATTHAHSAGETGVQGDERLRLYKNNFLRQAPDGILGVFDFEKLLESKPGSFTCDTRYVSSTDWLHFYRNVAVPKASMVVSSGVQPLFA